ncbi:MAG: SdrD B-like domain-containing protein, partial [Anaerolineales bacterium]|nr:SdrD B-like domain-containing protein [Anaerolineales bacterium]
MSKKGFMRGIQFAIHIAFVLSLVPFQSAHAAATSNAAQDGSTISDRAESFDPPHGEADSGSQSAAAAPGPDPAPGGYEIVSQDQFAPSLPGDREARVNADINPYVTPVNPSFTSGGLTIEPIAAYNLIVDSNVLAPSSYGPSSATLGAKFCNASGATMTDVWAYIGDYDPGTATGTPGTYAVRNQLTDPDFAAQHPHLVDPDAFDITTDFGGLSFSLNHESGSVSKTGDASRYVGTLAPGECRTQYWLVSYPRKANINGSWVSVTGGSIKPWDDLWLPYHFWATSSATGGTPSHLWRPVTMRNEISAMANKIWPNGDNKVPDVYKNAIDELLGWDTITPGGGNAAYPGETITSQGIWYDFGNVGFGFDNNGDGVPDRNAWVQPIGDHTLYDAGCFRLVRSYGIVIVKLNNGTELLIPFLDQLYFENIPSNNTGAVGLVYYEYAALDGACAVSLTPYQEVASGYDNEKFNADFGAGIPPLQSRQSNMTLDKTGQATIGLGGTMNYSITFTLPDLDPDPGDTQTIFVGNPSLGMPLVFQETVPSGLQYVGGSASATVTMTNYSPGSVSATRLYSTDSGATWSTTDPGTVTSTAPNNLVMIQWWLEEAIESPASGDAVTGTVSFNALVPGGYSAPVIENTACIKLGTGGCFEEDTHTTLVTGNGSIGDAVWADVNGDASQTGESGISGITVYLYYDANGNGKLDVGEPLIMQTETSGTTLSNYNFNNLPPGNYIVMVDTLDPQLPTGYSLTTSEYQAVTLAANQNYVLADFGFGPTLRVDKFLKTPNPAVLNELVTFGIDLNNTRPGDGTPAGFCVYDLWASNATTLANPKNYTNPTNAIGAPNLTYATGDFGTGSNKVLTGSVYSGAGYTANITKVETLISIYFNNYLVDDTILVRAPGTALAWTTTFTTAESNAFAPSEANKGYFIRQIPTANAPGGTWDWNDFALLSLEVEANKVGGADSSAILVDALGFRVTTDDPSCADGDSIINPLPLTDTYDPAVLQFVSAVPPVSSSTPAGTLTWDNVGPLYPGQTKVVTVTFKALTTTASTTNTASVTSAKFLSGRDVNDDSDTATVGVNASGSISGHVFADTNVPGTWTAGTGHSAGDTAIPGVEVQLWACISNLTGLPLPTAGAVNQPCTSGTNNGTWQKISTQYTSAGTLATGGAYSFTGLRDGFYNVIINTATLPPNFTTNSVETTAAGNGDGGAGGDSQWNLPTANLTTFNNIVNGVSGENITAVSFGYRDGGATTGQGAVVGYVWNDADNDGVWDAGETPIQFVTVQLYNSSNVLIGTVTTDVNGRYAFGDVPPAAGYYVVVTSPSDMSQSGDPDQPGVKCTICDNQTTTTFSVAANQLVQAGNFGYTGGLTIGDTIYVDWNGNATQDAGEEGIANVQVFLYRDLNGNNTLDAGEPLIDTQTTNASGFYQFSGLAGNGNDYIVVVNSSTIPAGYVLTADPQGAMDGRAAVKLTTTSVDTVDFGYQPQGSASIGDTIWRDTNGNGSQGSAEAGIAGVVVYLYQDQDGDGVIDPEDALVAAETTDSNGNYLFENLAAGNYIVQVAPSNFDPGGALVGLAGSGDPDQPGVRCTVCDNKHPVSVSGAETYLLADFGYVPLGSFGDTVYWDLNGNATQEASEPGIPGVTVNLHTFTDSNSNGRYDPGETLSGAPYDTAVTDANGKYLFTSLPQNTYVAVVDTGAGSPVENRTLTGDPDTDGIACTESPEPWTGFYALCDARTGMQIFPGTNFMGADFGFLPTAGFFGDYIWLDADADGVQDPGEPGLAGVTVTAVTTDNVTVNGVNYPGGTTLVTATDLDGLYSFGLITGASTWTVTVGAGLPSGVTATYDPDTGTTTPNGVTTVTMDAGGVVTNVGAGACSDCSSKVDFGYAYTGSYAISGTVCLDASTDGVCDDAELEYYENVAVTLVRWNDDNSNGSVDPGELQTLQTIYTAVNGNYVFAGLPNGNNYVSISGLPSYLTLTTDAGETPQNNISSTLNGGYVTAARQQITISDANVANVDFAFAQDLPYYDYGDLPDVYKTLYSSQGARHAVPSTPNLYLGGTVDVDTETNGAPTVDASGDGADEDGVTFNSPQAWTNGANADAVTVGVVGSGYLYAWMDFNDDGDFSDSGERFINGVSVTTASYNFNLSLPAGTFDNSKSSLKLYSRFRLFPSQPNIPSLAYFGDASNGEVEDYAMIWVMTVDKETTTPTVTPNGTVTYVIVVENTGNQPLTNLQVTDELPDFNGAAAGKGYTVTSVDAGVYTENALYDGDTDTNLLDGSDTLAVGASTTITITLQLSDAVEATYQNAVTAVTSQITVSDNGSENDEDVTVTNIMPPVISKSFSPNPIAEGGTSTLTITITNPNGGVALTGVAFTDNLPVGMTLSGDVTTPQCDGDMTGVSGGGVITLANGDIPADGDCTITATVTAAAAGTYVNATGIVTSTNGGDGNTANAKLGVIAAVKSVVATSEDATSGTNVAIGEIIRYRLVIELPEGVTSDLQVLENVVSNMSYLNDGTTTVAFICDSGPTCASSSDGTIGTTPVIIGSAPATPTFILPADAITNADGGAVTNPFPHGDNPLFSLDTITNNDNDASAEYVVIEFNTLVRNYAANQDANTRGNTFTVVVDGANLVTSNNAQVTIVEPAITSIAKAVTTTPTDAGDTIQYTLTFENTGTTPAFDIGISDTLNAILGTPVTVGGSTTGGACGSTASTVSGSYSAPTVTATVTCLNPGGTATVTIDATVVDTAAAGRTFTNSASLNYTSLPGTTGTPGASNPTGSTTPGASGSSSGERNGSGGTNDYIASSNTVSTTLGTPLVDKQDPDKATATIGETVTYTIGVTLPEGVTRDLTIIDALPTGMEFVSYTLNTTGFAGTAAVSTAPTAGATGNLTFDFGDTTTTADGDTDNNSFTIQVVAQVQNVIGNQEGDTLANTATLTYTNPNDLTTETVADPTAPSFTTIVEPTLNVNKNVSPATVESDNTVTYTLTIAHTAESDVSAYDVTVTDALGTGLSGLTNVNITLTPALCAAGITDNSTADGLNITIDSIPLGCTVAIEYDVTVSGANNDIRTNDVGITWTTLAGTVTGERTGADGPGGALNDYADSDSVDVTVTVGTGTVSGHLYYDANGNGTQDGTEPDLINVNILITPSTGAPFTVTTDANGDWTATVPPGSTTANVDETDTDFTSVVPAGWTQTEGADPTTVTAVAGQDTSAG